MRKRIIELYQDDLRFFYRFRAAKMGSKPYFELDGTDYLVEDVQQAIDE